MAKLKMKRIEIVTLNENGKEVFDYLQRCGTVQITKYDTQKEGFDTQKSVSQFEKRRQVAEEAISILGKYSPQKKGLLESFCDLEELEEKDFEKMSSEIDDYTRKCYEIVDLQKSINEEKAQIVRHKTRIEAVKPWEMLDIPMIYKGTKSTAVFIGTISGAQTEEGILLSLSELLPEVEDINVEVVSSAREMTCVVITTHKSDEEAVYGAIREMGFMYPTDPTRHPPKVRIARLLGEIEASEKKIEDMTEEIKSYSESYKELEFTADYYAVRSDKYNALSQLGLTNNTLIITGYVPEIEVEKLKASLEEKFTVAITVSEPEEDEEVPVLLKNGEFSAPVESITAMYALPGKDDVDPNPVMAFFYYLLFGMMLSDAGYGVVMTIGSFLALKLMNLKPSMKKTLKMFLYCGISTVFWGAMFGSWFGDIVSVIGTNFLGWSAPKDISLWMDPIKEPMTLLLVSFVIGIAHLFLGLGVHFVHLWKQGKKVDAFCDVVPTILAVSGAAPLCATVITDVPSAVINVCKWIAIIGVVLIILTAGRSSKNIFAKLGGGLYGLYNVASGYLSDILSSSRLLALGLSTGIIAQVVNMLGTLPENTVVKAILLVVVFIVGHTLNMAINLLGAYVHTNRLQYVELFSKFYEGGGEAFKPFKMNTKYMKFKEEKL